MRTQRLPVKLTTEEVRLRGIQMAGLENQFEEASAEAKQSAKAFKDSLESLRHSILKLTDQISSGKEYRDVQVEERKDWDTQEVLTIRLDTYEVVDRRPMTPNELSRGRSLFEADDQQPPFESEIETVTLSSGDRTVTLTGKQFDQAAQTMGA